MMLPELSRICEVTLHAGMDSALSSLLFLFALNILPVSSEGFKTAGELARKVVTLFDLMKQQFSKQDHYDFGLRFARHLMFF